MDDNVYSLIEFQIKGFVAKIRPPKEVRDKVDIAYSFEKNVFELFEIRPRWDNPSEQVQSAIAKAKYVKSKGIWKIYWMRANLKWYPYEPMPETKKLETVFKIIEEDEHHCFWG